MDLSVMQRRTLDGLIRVGSGVEFDPGLRQRLRDRIESGIDTVALPVHLRLWKERLNLLARCEGWFMAVSTAQRVPFDHRMDTAAGTLLHKAVELDAWSPEPLEPQELAVVAAERLEADGDFQRYWTGLDQVGRGECLMRAASHVEQFRSSFPPLGRMRRELAPLAEHWLEARFAAGHVVVLGKVDLMLGSAHPRLATRVLIDLKTGGGFPDQPEDMRLYALLHTLRTGVPPFRVATFHLRSGDWQPEDVTEALLEHAADRVASGVRTAAKLLGGREPELRPGGWCRRCPAHRTCPAVAESDPLMATVAGGRMGKLQSQRHEPTER